MRALTWKLWRDLWQMKGPAFAIMMVVAAGVAVLVASLSALDSLEMSRTTYYQDHHFADVFASARRAPISMARQVAQIPGVLQVQTRVVVDVSVVVPGMVEPAIGRLISIPEKRGPMLNDVYLREGRYIEPGHDDEVLLGESFALAHKLRPGDTLEAVVNGRKRRLEITGIALSPEYVYQISGASPWPDDKRFGVMWMGAEALRAALDMRGAFNDLTLTLAKGTSEQDVIDALDHLLAPYGGLGAHGRSQQLSDRFLSDKLGQLRTSGTMVPSIFLAVAAFLLNVVISRVISTQRSQIATLKAFGYSNIAIGLHYLQMALVLVAAGAAAGVGVGLWLGGRMTRLYAELYRFPLLKLRITASTAMLGVLISMAAASLGVIVSVWRAARLPPAEAMRPEAPASFKPSLIERLGLRRLMTPGARMIVRNVSRRPIRAILSSVGVAFAVAIVIVGRFPEDAVQYVMDLQFHLAQGEDATVVFYQPLSRGALTDLGHQPGVLRAEPMRAVPVILRAGHREHRAAIVGVERSARLHRLIDRNGQTVPLPEDGVVLGNYLAYKLGVRPGDPITVELLQGRRQVCRVPVAALVDDVMGASAIMDIDAMARTLDEGDSISGAFLAIDPLEEHTVYEALTSTPAVAGVSVTRAALESFEATLAANLRIMRTIQVIFSSIIAFAVVYNNARIALAERSRELASLRVLGFSRAEVSLILIGELAVTTLVGIPLGLGLGYFFAWGICESYKATEIFRMPLVIRDATYAYSALVVLISAALTALVVRRRIDQLDLVGVLKTRD